MTTPYRASPDVPRRRIHVPGVLVIHSRKVPATRSPPRPAGFRHWLRAGPAAGFYVGSIEDWQGRRCVLRRESLTEDMRRAHGVVLPEEALDAERWPFLHRAALASSLIAIDEARFAALTDAGARGYVVGWGETFELGRTLDEVRALPLEGWVPEGEVSGTDELSHDMLGDRLLRVASGGEIDDAAVSLAVQLAGAAEDEWVAADVRRMLTHIPDPPDDDRESAAGIVRAIEAAGEDDDEIEIPVYGAAYRVRLPALVHEGSPITRIPPRSVWRVEDVEREPNYGPAPRRPAPPPAEAPALPPARPARSNTAVVAACVLAVIALLVVVTWLLASR